MKKIIYIIASLALVACNPEKTVESCKVKLEVNDNLSIHELFSEIELIPLSSPDSIVIDFIISKTVFHDKYVYILNPRLTTLFIFDHKGRYINKLEKGEGPDNFLALLDYNINRFTGNLEILTQNKILIYDNIGEKLLSVQRINTPRMPDCFMNIDRDNDVLFCQLTDKKILLYNRTDNLVVDSLYEMPRYIYNTLLGYNASPFYLYNDTVHFLQGYDGSQFTLNINDGKGNISLHSKWDFGIESFSYKKLEPNKSISDYLKDCKEFSKKKPLGFFSCAENSRYKIANFWYKETPLTLIYDKNDGKNIIIEKFKEEIDFGFSHIDENYCYLLVPMNDIHSVVNESILNQTNKDILNSLNEEDNPVIVKYRFKQL